MLSITPISIVRLKTFKSQGFRMEDVICYYYYYFWEGFFFTSSREGLVTMCQISLLYFRHCLLGGDNNWYEMDYYWTSAKTFLLSICFSHRVLEYRAMFTTTTTSLTFEWRMSDVCHGGSWVIHMYICIVCTLLLGFVCEYSFDCRFLQRWITTKAWNS